MLLAAGCIGVYCFRSANGALLLPLLYGTHELSKGNTEARIVFAVMCIMLIDTIILCFQKPADGSHANSSHRKKMSQTGSTLDKLFHGIQNIWILLMFLLMRPHNICLLAMISAQELCLRIYLRKMCDSFTTTSISLLYLWMGQAAFYYQVSVALLYVICNDLFTLSDTDGGTKVNSDFKPDGYIVPCKTCLHCTDTDLDPSPDSDPQSLLPILGMYISVPGLRSESVSGNITGKIHF